MARGTDVHHAKARIETDGKGRYFSMGTAGSRSVLRPHSASEAVWLERSHAGEISPRRRRYGSLWHLEGTKEKKQNNLQTTSLPVRVARSRILHFLGTSDQRRRQWRPAGRRLHDARPELFGAALPAVGVLDMLRFTNCVGWAWTSDYDARMTRTNSGAYTYSPLPAEAGTRYPATLHQHRGPRRRVVRRTVSCSPGACRMPGQGWPASAHRIGPKRGTVQVPPAKTNRRQAAW
jgi:prolyl oligopeptidase